MDRRGFLASAAGAGASLLTLRFLGDALPMAHAADADYGALQAADANGIQLPAGFSSRVIARSGVVVPGSTYAWHSAPDGAACFPRVGGGWTYVSNSEVSSAGGGAGSIDFDASGAIVTARRILGGTTRNCSGGATPWGTWLSCEENGAVGIVWECDPTGALPAIGRPAMGAFNHEATACDPVGQHVYLTEDDPAGKLRRFRPTTWGDLSTGVLEAAVVSGSTVTWTTNIASGTAFNGGEGVWYANRKVWFTTKGDNRVREIDLAAQPNTIRVLYDPNAPPGGVLTGVDQIVGSASGDLFVCEDGGNMEIVMIDPTGAVSVFLRVLNQSSSEMTGLAFSPDGGRMYCSSQRGTSGGGIIYEITGPFRSTFPTTTTTSSTTSSTTTTRPPTTTTTSTTVAGITLTATVRVAGKKWWVDLRWSGAKTSTVQIRRNGSLLTSTANDGVYSDQVRSRGSYRYSVSASSGSPISNEVIVTV